MGEDTLPPDIVVLTFEEALGELEDIVRSLESGSGKLEEAITAAERGAKLKAHCERKLQEARLRVDKIVLGADGSPRTEPMDGE